MNDLNDWLCSTTVGIADGRLLRNENRRPNGNKGSMIALLRHHHPLDYPSDVGVSNNLQN